MIPNRLAFVALGLGCLAAAAGGGYFATRHNVADRAVADLAASTTTDAPFVTRPVAAEVPVVALTGAAEQPAKPPASIAAAAGQEPSKPPVAVATPTPVSASRQTSPRGVRVEEQPGSPERGWSPSTVPVAAALPPTEPPVVARNEERPVEMPKAPEPTEPAFVELTVAADSVIGLRTDAPLSSERARVEDRVEARVVRDVRVGGRVAIPAGTQALGSVVLVERGGKMRDRARLGIRFHTLALADGVRLPIATETIYRYGDLPGNDSAKKIGGGAVAGAILGAIIGGGKGAAIGATTGAAGGGAAVMAGNRSEAVFTAGADVTARMLAPFTVTLER